jgi:hypothetical protein
MRAVVSWVLLVALVGCASTKEGGELSAYGVAEAWSVSGPNVERLDAGKTTCSDGTVENPCVASYAGGWEPFAAAISATLEPLAGLVTSGAALLLGRDVVPVVEDTEPESADSRFGGAALDE